MGRDVGENNPFALPRVLENVAGITYAMTDLPAGMTYDDTAHTIAGAPTLAGTGIATLTATPPCQYSDSRRTLGCGGTGASSCQSSTIRDWTCIPLHC